MRLRSALPFLVGIFFPAAGFGADWSLPSATPADKMLRGYFERRVAEIESASALAVKAPAEWPALRDKLRQEFKEMLGLEPEPPRTSLEPVITGTLEGDGFVVEKLHFQPMPRLYLAANFYRPKEVREKLPAILYLCGHGRVEKDGVSLGNKTHYHHHGVWFARHGYVCLILDTVQWGEILGEHHGTHRLGRWWWPARGYTPAGVEAWIAVRGLDYLETRPEVDAKRFGVTGRSGGGAYTWWVTALDDRVKAAVPTAGITTLRNHVLDGCIEGHCDCMFMQNTHRWDYDRVAALAAPRPLLISNTDKDSIFPLDGVYAIYQKTRVLYEALGAGKNIGLHIAEGPHKDTQALNVGAFAWFERHLKSADLMATLDEAAKPSLAPEPLRVFSEIPRDERTRTIDRDFVPMPAPPPVSDDAAQWAALRDKWMNLLREKVFGAWPANPPALDVELIKQEPLGGHACAQYRFRSDASWAADLWVAAPVDARADKPALLEVNDFISSDRARQRLDWLCQHAPDRVNALFVPRGAGLAAWSGDDQKKNHIRRRFLLLGETMEGAQTWDIRRAIQALREILRTPETRLELRGFGSLGVCALYASLFEPGIETLNLSTLPDSHMSGPTFLNVLKYFDLPQALALATERSSVSLNATLPAASAYAAAVSKKLRWSKTVTTRALPKLIEVEKTWDAAPHNAFTDLLRRGDEWFCVFRESSAHVPGTNGTIRVLRSHGGRSWENTSVAEEGVDLRDPKISEAPDGRLMLLMGGSIYNGENAAGAKRKLVSARNRVSFSNDGRQWTPPVPVAVENHWLWRVTWHEGVAYGGAYSIDPKNRHHIDALRTAFDGGLTEFSSEQEIGPEAGAEPNEATLRWSADGTQMWLVRGEQADKHAFFGKHRRGFSHCWTDVGRPVQGPNFVVDQSRRLWYSGRDYEAGEARTVFGEIHDGQALPLITLPSGGDCSYPGMDFAADGKLWLSYYSSHEGKASIYLARIELPDAIEPR